jgi:[acyl-carrier-protein] S-malonyltransferase
VKKTAFLFPGQGSQAVGMGLDLYQAYDFAKEIFDQAEEITKINVSDLCFNGPMADLTQTIHLQPAITAVNLALLSALKQKGINADLCAGHSLGEYSALCATGVIDAADTLRIVFKRGQLMHREAEIHKGAMQAIIGLSIDTVADIVANIDGPVSVANHNSKRQIVITGKPAAVKEAAGLAKERGGKAIPLKVSGAWHSDLIRGATDDFRDFLDTITFLKPRFPVIHNVTADVCSDPGKIKALMVTQLCHPIRWYDTILRMLADDIKIFVEVGPGKVLSGLVRKIMPPDYSAKIFNVNDFNSLERFCEKFTAL